MRTLRGLASTLLIALVGSAFVVSVARSAEAEITDPREKELRAAAESKEPAALRELACFLYDRRRYGSIRARTESFELLRDAAKAGDDIAVLYYIGYLRYGYHAPKNEDEADRMAMTLLTKIRRGQSPHFSSSVAAALEVKSGRCGFSDFTTQDMFMEADNVCLNIKKPKPVWCG